MLERALIPSMKRVSFILIALISFQAIGQINKLDIGVIGGPGFSFLYGDPNKIQSPSRTISARGASGVFVQYDFNKYMSLSGDILYNQAGANQKFGDVPGRYFNVPTFLNYLTIPILLKAGFGSKVHFYGIAGPYVGFYMYGKEHNPLTGNVMLNYQRIDAGLVLGAGLSVHFAKRFAFICEFRNDTGLYNISKGVRVGTPTFAYQATRNFSGLLMLGASYKFFKTKRSKI